MAEQRSSSALAAPLRSAASAVRKVPGTGVVSRAAGGLMDQAEGVLGKIETVPPRQRRLAVYAGAGVLGVTGVVEWPVALTGAAVAWLTQPRSEPSPGTTAGAAAPGTRSRASAAGSGGAKKKATAKKTERRTSAQKSRPSTGGARKATKSTASTKPGGVLASPR